MPRSRYQQQESARKRWRDPSATAIGRPRPIAYRVEHMPPRPPSTVDAFPVEGTDSKSLQRAYRRAKRHADNVDGIVKAVYG